MAADRFDGRRASSREIEEVPPAGLGAGEDVAIAAGMAAGSGGAPLVAVVESADLVTITVGAANDPPVAVDDGYSTPEDTELVVTAPGVLANDTDVDGDSLTAVLGTTTGNGTLSLAAAGSFTYTPDLDFTGTDSFTYFANDGTGNSATAATVSITVTSTGTTLTFLPTDDAYVDSKKATRNYGSASLLQVRAGSKEFDSYLKFTVAGVSSPVLSAKLRLWVTKDSPSGGSVFVVSNDYSDSSGPWTETGLVWNNAPAITGTALDTLGAVLTGTWVEFDVTAAISGDGMHSVALRNESSNVARYSSKEAGGNLPVLVITLGN